MNIAALTQVQAAALLSVAPRTMRDWSDAPRNPDGTYNGPSIVAYYVSKMAGDELDLNRERARLAKEQADRTALSNAVARGDVIPSAVALQQWSDHIVAARAKLLAMPTKLGPQLINISEVNLIAAAIKAAVIESLDELARWRPAAGGGEPVAVTAEPDGEPVGGRGKATQQRGKRRARAVED